MEPLGAWNWVELRQHKGGGRGQERDPPREPEQGLSWASWERLFQSRALWGSGDPQPQALNEVSSAPPSPEATQPGVDFEGTRDTCGPFLPPWRMGVLAHRDLLAMGTPQHEDQAGHPVGAERTLLQ